MSINTVEYANQLLAENADLKKQVQALAAENSILDFIISAVKEVVRDSEGVTGWHLNGDVASWDEVLPELDHSETPATDAAIREIGAKAVEGFAKDCDDNFGLVEPEDEELYVLMAEAAKAYAAKLLAGEKT